MTEEDFIPKCLKSSLLFLNLVYWILGLGAAVFGLYMQIYEIQPIQELISAHFRQDIMLIAVGIMIIITSVFGFVGVWRENIFYLRLFLIALMFLLMISIAMGVLGLVEMFYPPTVHVQAQKQLRKAVTSYKDDNKLAEHIDRIQTSVQCCGIGVRGYKDWLLNPYFACNKNNYLNVESCSVPPSCCKLDAQEIMDTTCGYGQTSGPYITKRVLSTIYVKGCVPKIEEIVQHIASRLCFSAFGIAIGLICGVILSSRTVNIVDKKMREFWHEHEQALHYSRSNNMMHYRPNSGTDCTKRDLL